jgi:two-component system response regulator FlrC
MNHHSNAELARARAHPSSPRILVVEDDAAMRELVVSTLTRDGYQVVEASSGSEAVRLIEELSLREWSRAALDLVLTDVCMPGMTGSELSDLIRTARWPVEIILMTAFPRPDVRAQAERLGTELLAKPFPLEILSRVVLLRLAARAKSRPPSDWPR